MEESRLKPMALRLSAGPSPSVQSLESGCEERLGRIAWAVSVGLLNERVSDDLSRGLQEAREASMKAFRGCITEMDRTLASVGQQVGRR